MTNVLLSSLLAGSFALGAPTGDGPTASTPSPSDSLAAVQAEVVSAPGRSVFATDEAVEIATPRSITQDTYAFGIPSDAAPIKLWVSYAYGEAESIWDTRGEDAELQIGGANGDIVTQRINAGAQVNVISFPSFKLGAGAQLGVAKNEFQVGSDGDPLSIGNLESDFGLQNVKVYGVARGRVVGVHAGYMFDLGSEREFRQAQAPLGPNGQLVNVNLPTTLSNSDGRDAIIVGADFDVPSDRFRLFGGIDYYMLQGIDDDTNTIVNENEFDNDDFLNFLVGAGVKLSVFEIGAALQIQTRYDNPTVQDIGTTTGIGSHAGTIAPYLRISPPSLPASIFIKGAVQDEYTEYGYAIGGANSIKPSIGFTAGLTIGFE